MDESDVDICQASNNTDVFREENGQFTNDLETGSGTEVNQQKDGANDFESLTRPISAVSAASSVVEDSCFKSNSSEVVREDDTNSQNNEECSRDFRSPEELLEGKFYTSPGLHSNTVQNSTSPSDNKVDATVPDDSLEDDQIKDNVFKASKSNSEPDPSAEFSDFPRFSSPIIGSGEKSFEDIAAEIRELNISQNTSAVDSGSRNSDDELSKLSFPEVPSNDPAADFVDRSNIDGGSVSRASTHSLSRSYIYSSVSVSEDLQDDGNHLVPKFEANGRGFCWPIHKLPLSGERKFEEGAQWKIPDESNPIGYGASGQCFLGHPLDEENNIFCVKKCKVYIKKEVEALLVAAKEIYAKKISEGAKKIVLFYGATYYKPNVCIFMEYMEGGTVHDAINEANKQYKDGLDEIDCVIYFKDVLLALEFIHRKGIVHNDIKANNVLLTASKLEAKLCDFGKAAAIDQQQHSASRDVWAAGCFLLEMLGKKYAPALRRGIAKKTDVLNRLPDNVDPDTRQVLSMCFYADRNRYTASDVLRSAFFDYKAN